MLKNKLWIILLLLIGLGINLKAEEIPEKVRAKIVESYSKFYGYPQLFKNYKENARIPFVIRKAPKTHSKDLTRYMYIYEDDYTGDPNGYMSDYSVVQSILKVDESVYHMPYEYNLYVTNEEDGFTKKNANEKIRNFIKLFVEDQDIVFEEIVWKDTYAKNSDGTNSNRLFTNVEVITSSKNLPYNYHWIFKYTVGRGIGWISWGTIGQPEGEPRIGGLWVPIFASLD